VDGWLFARVGTLPGLVLSPVGAELVVLLARFRVRENLVRLVDLLEPLLGFFVFRIEVRMILPSELPVGRLDLFLGRRLGNPEDRVIILIIQ
jgi:hypothetical protein